ncbi:MULTISPECIES: hypothetical protein [Pseudoalteromonas]|uniref:Uncharacterized protein n=1 Tax=Pseudoalteromonas luteoviolacea (strain 2ta16) TaxID=1353533 RepID=V4JAS8_PSEL2|nr:MULTISPECIES: hypothetical protein [Pseudoalteromonas]ESP92272.1 hypothetical protein PL2TA16_05109 [Pseudoalteromonas luteoviolacea 2ta16]KZN29381.1 hypothetical protein N483_08055 [Pseudoalteromonas luteoviolacea NCIMB 1944]MCG7549291.1 hypothetical protein [Pseudoalteromonas sp. Of7M-16]
MQVSNTNSTQYSYRPNTANKAQTTQGEFKLDESGANSAKGIDVRGKANLIYLLEKKDIVQLSKDEVSWLADIKESFMSVQETENYFKSNGQKKEMNAIIYVEGNVVSYQTQDGGVYYTDSKAEEIFRKAGFDAEKVKGLVKEMYPDGAKVQFFEAGEGPSNAQLFEQMHGYSYNEFVRKQVDSLKQSELNQQLQQEKYYRSKVLFEQSPQTEIFSVGGQVVASRGENGYIDVGQHLLAQADARGIKRSELKEIFTVSPERTAAQYQALLQDVFGDEVTLQSFHLGDAPTRAEVKLMQANNSSV